MKFITKENFLSEMIELVEEYVLAMFPQTAEIKNKYSVGMWDGRDFESEQWVRIVWEKEFGFKNLDFLNLLKSYVDLKDRIFHSDRSSRPYHIQQLGDFLKEYSTNTISSEESFVEYWKNYISTGVCGSN